MSPELRKQKSFSKIRSKKPKILFIGVGESSHDRSFTELFIDDFDVRFFAMPTFVPPNDWPIITYTTCPTPPMNMDPQNRINLYPTPEDIQSYVQHISTRKTIPLFLKRLYEEFSSSLNILFRKMITLEDILPPQIQVRSNSLNHWLIEIIESWQPDIIHTFGIERGFVLQDSWEMLRGNSPKPFIWIQQTRGGSDLTFNRFDPAYKDRLLKLLHQCNSIICDNVINLKYLEEIGVDQNKFASVCPVPGTGGLNINDQPPLSIQKHLDSRDIIWPKAYFLPYSMPIPVLEAIKIAWEKIQPCTIHMLPADQGMRLWYYSLPKHIRNNCRIYDYMEKNDLLELMRNSRITLAPSLIDGIPNVLYEAMIAGALPIVSPLETIKSMVNEKNVLFADNMNSQEIANALISAMTNDEMVSKMINRNIEFVKVNFNRQMFKSKLVNFYHSILS